MTTYKIARNELAQLFYSPIAWFLLAAFAFQSGLAYTDTVDGYMTQQALGGRSLENLTFLTSKIFSPPFGIWPDVTGKLYLYLPLLTMGLVSRELSSGTIKLLYSSPVRVWEIIFGKFLAMMFYSFLLTGILMLISVAGWSNIHAADKGLLLAGMLGVYLLLCTYSAIGLFMSCLTAYQLVAALCTLLLLATLSYIGTLWQDIDFVRDITWFLSINSRAEHMLLGLIVSRDILYFLLIIFSFLGFSIYKLQSARETRPLWVRAGRNIAIVAGAVTCGYIGSRPGLTGYFDATATKTMTLTSQSQKIINATGDAPIEVISYVNLLDNHFWHGKPADRNRDLGRWEAYLRFKPDVKFKYVYFYDSTRDKNLYKYNPNMSLRSLAERHIRSYKLDAALFKTPEEMRNLIDLRPEQNRYVMQMKYKDRATFLRLFNDPMVFPSETETDAALKRLLREKTLKIRVLQGEQERSIFKSGDRDYKTLTSDITFRYALINQGFDVDTLSLGSAEVPADVAALVIVDPLLAFDSAVTGRIRRFIDRGGNLLIAGEPRRKDLLNPLLAQLGVRLMDGMLLQQSKDFSADLILAYPMQAASALTKRMQQDAADSLPVSMPGAAALTCLPNGPFSVTPFVMTDGQHTWNRKDQLMKDGQELPDTVRKEGDQQGAYPVVVGLTRQTSGREQRIVISGDADLFDNAELIRRSPRICNFQLGTALFSWLGYGEYPVDTTPPPSLDDRLDLTDRGLDLLKILFLGIVPALLLATGAFLLIRRKRK